MDRLLMTLALLAACATTPREAAPTAGDPVLHRLTEAQVRRTLRDLFFDERLPDVVLPRDIPVHGFENNALVRDVTPYVVESLQRDLMEVSRHVVSTGGPWLACDPRTAEQEADCARRALAVFVQRAWRRPASAEELEGLFELYQGWSSAEGAEVALTLLVQVVLQSPEFLYLVETPDDGLSDWEIASRLSFFLWDSMPDSELFRAAAAGELSQRKHAVDQARRLFRGGRARQAVRDFYRQWLDVRAIGDIRVDTEAYFSEGEAGGYELSDLRIAFEGEIDGLIDSVVFGAGTLDALLTSRRTWVSEATARLYDAQIDASGPERVEYRFQGADIASVQLREASLPPDQRAGVFTTGAFLASHAHPLQPSPVLRGVFLRERLLCLPTPKPPDDVPPLETEEVDGPQTNRERYAAHTTNPACAGCHISIDGAGFPFESYDSLGGWRTTDNGQPIDTTGELVSTDVDGPVTDAIELIETLAGSRQVHDCMVTQWFRYASHRTETEADAAALAALQERFWSTGGSIPDLLVEMATSDFFLTQTAGGEP